MIEITPLTFFVGGFLVGLVLILFGMWIDPYGDSSIALVIVIGGIILWGVLLTLFIWFVIVHFPTIHWVGW